MLDVVLGVLVAIAFLCGTSALLLGLLICQGTEMDAVQAKRLAHHDGAPCVLCGHALVRTGNFVVHQEEVVRKGKCSHCAYLQPIYRKWDTP